MTSRPRLLFLSQCTPYPPHSGVTNRTYNILRQLRREYDVTVLAFSRRRHQADAAARAAARARLEALGLRMGEPVEIPSQASRPRQIWDHLRSVGTRRPYVYYEYWSPAYRAQLADALREGPPALVHVDSLDLYRWCDGLPAVPVACTHHNIESDLLRRRARHTAHPLLSRYIDWQAARTEAVEREEAPRFDLNVMMSDVDAARLRELAPGARTVVAPNGVDVEAFTPTPEAGRVPGRVAFLGPLYMFANRDGVEFLLDEMWERIAAGAPGASLHLIGQASAEDRAWAAARPGVSSLGYVPDIRPHLAEAECCVVPLRVGGGTRLKILDYWAMGKAVVSTSVGCEGLATVDGENILIRDDPREFADAVREVLRSPELRRRLETNARRTAETVYSWDIIGEDLRRHYARLVDRAGAPGGAAGGASRAVASPHHATAALASGASK